MLLDDLSVLWMENFGEGCLRDVPWEADMETWTFCPFTLKNKLVRSREGRGSGEGIPQECHGQLELSCPGEAREPEQKVCHPGARLVELST